MVYAYQLNRELLVNDVHIAPFNLEQGRIYYLKSKLFDVEKWLLNECLSDHINTGRAMVISAANAVKWFRFRSVYNMLVRRSLSSGKSRAGQFFKFFHLPADVPVNELRGFFCNLMFNFEYYYNFYDLIFIPLSGLDGESIRLMYEYLKQKEMPEKCIVILDAGMKMDMDDSVAFRITEWRTEGNDEHGLYTGFLG